MNSGLFDISKTDDLPEDMAEEVTGGTNSVTSKGMALARLMAGAGPVTVAQVRAALYRSEGRSVTAATVRAYLAAAAEAGLIERPTRQTYRSLVEVGADDSDEDQGE